jgi:hypothetical protein
LLQDRQRQAFGNAGCQYDDVADVPLSARTKRRWPKSSARSGSRDARRSFHQRGDEAVAGEGAAGERRLTAYLVSASVIRPHIVIGLGRVLIGTRSLAGGCEPVDLGSMIQVGIGPLEIMSAHPGLFVGAFGAVLLIFGLWRRRRAVRQLRSR